MNNQHSAAIGRNQENRLLLPIPTAGVRNWKLEARKSQRRSAADTNFDF